MLHSFQRGDIVDVSMLDGEHVYRGLVFSATKQHGIYVITRYGASLHRHGEAGTTLRLVKRFGLKSPRQLFRLRALTSTEPRSRLTTKRVCEVMAQSTGY